MSKVLVTGGAGFIGSHLVDELLRQGHYVRVLDNFSTGLLQNLKHARGYPASSFRMMKADIRNKKACHEALRNIEYVFHFAGLVGLEDSVAHPAEYADVNITGTVNMLVASMQQKVKRFMLASSCSVYGEHAGQAAEKRTHTLPVSPYGITKDVAEQYCRCFSRNYKLPTASLRFFNVYGPRQSGTGLSKGVIPYFIERIDQGKPVYIHGTGKQTRDFIFVDDVVRGCMSVMRRGHGEGDIFNLASGKSYRVLDVARLVARGLGKKAVIKFLPVRCADVERSFADIRHTQKRLGWSPRVELADGLVLTASHIRKSLA